MFKNNVNPVEDFMQAPPGILALDVLLYFARHHAEDYTKVSGESGDGGG